MKRYLIIYQGRVQGVGFRYQIAMLADNYNITGYVENLDNGNVQLEAQGEKVDLFFAKTLTPDRFIRIDDYALKEIPVIPNEKKFIVKYY